MTVGAYTPNSYNATGVAGSYAYGFRILDQTHLLVQLNGVNLTLTTDYTVDGVGQNAGGNITPVTPAAIVGTLVLSSNVPYTRSPDFQDDFRPKTFNDDQDLQTMQARQLAEAVNRALTAPIGSVFSGQLPSVTGNALKVLRLNAATTAFEYVDQGSVALAIPADGSVTRAKLAADVKAATVAQTDTAFTTGGAGPNFTLTPTAALGAYAAGIRYRVKFNGAGAGADQLNVSALGNKAIKQYDSTGAKIAATIKANMLCDVEFDGVDFVILDQLPAKEPTITVLTSGSGTYTTPTGATRLRRRIIGAGGGGGGTSTNGGAGGNTTFGTLTANGGAAGVTNQAFGGLGGSASGGSININGGGGGSSWSSTGSMGGVGGSSAFGGAGRSAAGSGNAGAAAEANSGSGGGGASNAGGAGCSGGGSGGYCEDTVIAPAATYSYAVGAAGTAGTAGGGAGGAGAAGIIIIEEFYD